MLYLATHDSINDYIEANSFSDAIAVWKTHVRKSEGGLWDEDPESLALVHDEPVIRECGGVSYLLTVIRQALTHIESDESTHGRAFAAGNMCRAAIAAHEGAK